MKSQQIDIAALLQMQPISNTADAVFNLLSKQIQSGELPEGYVFPNETALCEKLSVGRTSLREAYKALEVSGYVTRTKRGTIVNSKHIVEQHIPLSANMEHASSKDFLEFRIMIEAQGAFWAAQRATKADIAEIKVRLSDCIAACQNGNHSEILRTDRLFHRAIASCSKNSLIESSMDAVASVWYRETSHNLSYALKTQPELPQFMNVEHSQLLEAIIAKDAETAREIISHHIRHVSHK